MEFNKIIESIWFISAFHLTVFFLLGVNIYYVQKIYVCEKTNSLLAFQKEDLRLKLERFENREAYENSQNFQDKELKNRNYKFPGEGVIDVSPVEPVPSNPQALYIPQAVDLQENNFQAWINFFNPKAVNKTTSLKCGF